MQNIFEKAVGSLLAIEGGYSNHKFDRGGETRFGITEKTARANGFTDEMREFPFWRAKQIYKKDYWDVMRLPSIQIFSPAVARELFESGVNCGTTRASIWFQQTINLLTDEELDVDGIIGKKTLAALSIFNDSASRELILKMLNAYQANHYIKLCTNDSTQKTFIRGWFRRIKV